MGEEEEEAADEDCLVQTASERDKRAFFSPEGKRQELLGRSPVSVVSSGLIQPPLQSLTRH